MNFTNSTITENDTDNNKYTKENIIVILLSSLFIITPFIVLLYKIFNDLPINNPQDNLPEDSIPNITIDNNPLQMAIATSVNNPLQVSDNNDLLPVALPIHNNVYVNYSNNC